MIAPIMREFHVLFDELSAQGGGSAPLDPAMASYGGLVFPPPPPTRPWIYANFVQTIDGIVSLLGDEASGADIGGLPEDRWLMDLLRAHADAVILGMGTLRAEQRLERPRPRGPVFRIVHPELEQLRTRLGRGRQRNILVTARAAFQLGDYAVFDGELVDATVLTTHEGARSLDSQRARHPARGHRGRGPCGRQRGPGPRPSRRSSSVTESATCSARADLRCTRACSPPG